MPQEAITDKMEVEGSSVLGGGVNSAAINSKKVATHSHIKGLGLREDGHAENISSGFVGQLKAREVKGMH